MKGIRLILIAFAMLITSLAFSAIPPKVFDAMKVGNSTELAKYFNNSVEVAILETEAVYSRQQAEQVVKNFFDKNSPKNFTLLHQGGKSEAQYAIGTLEIIGGKKFRVYFLVKEQSGTPLIHQLRIEEEQ
ncbi:MAG: DUF4783 domain-containing protein [Bacteroidales bacterium]|nr:DUF4783 domain-containing protein [Bacteroidales bacterium]